jgi:hypothetical protein
MKNSELMRWESLERVQRFMHADAPDDPRFTSLRKELDEVCARLRENIQRQASAANTLAADGITIRNLAEELREDQLMPIVRRAKSIVRNQPKREEMLKVPHKHATGDETAAYALALAAWLQKYSTAFVDVGFSKDFLKKLAASATTLAAACKHSGSQRRARTQATAAIEQDLQRGVVLRSAIDGVLQPFFKTVKGLRFAWKLARRVQKRRGRPKKRRRPPGTT